MYQVILADCPWEYKFSRSKSRKVENHYPTLSIDEIAELPVSEIAEEDCVLFMWSPQPKLPQALYVMIRWGFEYKTGAMWDKVRIGPGYYWRQRHEQLLLGTRGSPGVPLPEDRPDSVFQEPRSARHSRKPESVYEMIERMYPGRTYCELFATQQWPGWDAWGDEVAPGKSLLEMTHDKSSDCGGEPIVRADT